MGNVHVSERRKGQVLHRSAGHLVRGTVTYARALTELIDSESRIVHLVEMPCRRHFSLWFAKHQLGDLAWLDIS
jgi:hypothetical protein